MSTTFQLIPAGPPKRKRVSNWALMAIVALSLFIILSGAYLAVNWLVIKWFTHGGIRALVTPYLRHWFWFIAFVSLVGGGIAGFYRAFQPEREERREAQLVVRDCKKKDLDIEDMEWQMQIKHGGQPQPKKKFTEEQVWYHARLYLRRYYEGIGVSRQSWEADGYSKTMWDYVNNLMKKYGIRDGSKQELEYPTYSQALDRWMEQAERATSHYHVGGDFLVKAEGLEDD